MQTPKELWERGNESSLIQRNFDERMQTGKKMPALTYNQRYLYTHYLHTKKRYPNAPCFVPKYLGKANLIHEYINALQRLEDYGLVSVDRSAPNYRGWTLNEPRRGK